MTRTTTKCLPAESFRTVIARYDDSVVPVDAASGRDE